MARKHRLAALVYDGLCTFEFSLVVECFGLSRPEIDASWYEFRACGVEEGPFRAIGGVSLNADHGLETLRWADTIVVPGWRDADAPVPSALCAEIRRAHDRGARLVSICSGVFVLAAAGVLRGRRATTHWRYVDRLKTRYPDIDIEPDTLYVDEGQVLTSAGSAAGLDLCIHIVRRDFGSAIANSVARRLVLPTHRDGGQAQFIPTPVATEGQAMGMIIDWVRTHLHEPLSVRDMAAQARQSERTFVRHFKAATGLPPHAWLTRERVGRARELLETTMLNMDQIAEKSGFVTAETLRHHFRRDLKVSPTQYRSAFGNA